MKKRLIALLLVLVLAAVLVPAEADAAQILYSGSCGTNLTWTLDDEGLMTISGSGAMTDYSVYGTGRPWNDIRGQIVELVVESGVTSIGRGAFNSCKSLTKVTLPDTVTKLGDDAFAYCHVLEEINIPSAVQSIGQLAFESCYALKQVTIPEGVTAIGQQTFSGCRSLQNVTIPSTVKTIGVYAFEGCDTFTRVVIPEGTTSIAQMAFASCDNLEQVEISSTVASIATDKNSLLATLPFLNCPKLTGIWVAENNAKYCSDEFGVLYNKDMTQLIEAPGALAGEYTVPEGVTQIVLDAFYNCDRVTGITIPASVTAIGETALYGCDSLEWFAVAEENQNFASDEAGFLLDKAMTTIVQAPGGYMGVYTVPSTVTTLGEYSFGGCTKLTEVVLHEGCPKLSSNVFYGCTGLTKMTIPEGYTSIPKSAFENCTGLQRVELPSTLTIISDNAFENCTGLTELNFPEGLTSIYGSAFAGCTGLTELEFPSTLRTLSYMAFSRCTGLKTVRFAGKCPSNSSSFNATTISDAYYPEGATGWTEAAMTALSSTAQWHSYRTCGKNLTWAFDETTGTLTISGTGPMYAYGRNNSGDGGTCDWEGLKDKVYKVVIEEGVTDIADYAFYSFNNLASISLPSTLEEIGLYCAYVNKGLHHVIYAGTQEQKAQITVSYGNNAINNATWHYEVTEDPITVTPADSCTLACTTYCALCDSNFYGGHDATHSYSGGTCTECGSDEIWTYEIVKTGVKITGYSGSGTGTLVIPDTFETVPVSYIGSSLFQNQTGFTGTLDLPDSVFYIGSSAFSGCSGFTRVDMPASLKYVYGNAFYGCTGLKQVHITDLSAWCRVSFSDMYSNPTQRSKNLYLNGQLLTRLEIPADVTSIGNYAFAYLTGITEIRFPGDCPTMGTYTFRSVTATAYYPTGNDTWNENTMVDYGGSLSWKAYCLTEHAWGEWEVTTQPECEKEGTKVRTCPCGAEEKGVIPALGHDMQETTVDPTCEERGYTAQVCSRCGISNVLSYTDALGHNWDEWITDTAPTCTEAGTAHRECLRCDAEESKVLAATGHSHEGVVTPPTCTTRGYTTYTCTGCGDSYVSNYVPATGHAYGEWVTVKEATCVQEGESRRECANCGLAQTKNLGLGDHGYSSVVTQPTCTEAGFTTHICAFCGDTYTDAVTEVLGHDFGEWETAVEVTCTEDGEQRRDCSRCDHFETQTVSKLGHNYESTVTDPTCTEDGYTTHTCKRCGDTYRDTPVTAPGHDYKSIVTEPDCNAGGYTTHTCSRCGHSYTTDQTEPLGHSWGEWIIDKEAGCMTDGFKHHDCTRCGERETYVIPFEGHTYEDGVCTRCGEKDPGYVEPDPGTANVIRLSGKNRYDTAFAVANQLKKNLGITQFGSVVVAYGQNFPDALTGSYLAAVKNAPILLTEKSADARVLAYIEENLVPGGTVYILGGTAAVTQEFEDGANELGFTVKRLKDKNRYGTNLKILEEAGVNKTDEILIATGTNYADSLSASATGLPMLLVGGSLTEEQKAFLATTSGRFVIIGGTGAVSQKVEDQLNGIGTAERVKGKTRYETSVVIAQRYFGSPKAAVLAYAQGFPDGLCGGPLAMNMGAPLILTSNESPAAADAYIEGITVGAVTGGTGRITDDTVRAIFDLAMDALIPTP